jgi:general secretion pathway protein F
MQFTYRVANPQGKVETGREEADTREQLISKLKAQGKFPLEVKESPQLSLDKLKKTGLSRQERLTFTQQLAGMLSSGIPLEKALAILCRLQFSPEMSEVVTSLRRSIQEGKPFTAALEKFSSNFPPLYINMVRAGEAGGILPAVLERLAQYLEEEIKLRRYITSSLFYPAIVVVVSMGAILFYVGVVIPKFQSIFQDMGAELPFITRMVMLVGSMVTNFWWVFVAAAVLVGVWLAKERSTPEGRLRLDQIKLKIPGFGPIIQKIATSRMALALSLLSGSGVPILNSLNIASQIVGNEVLAHALREVERKVKQGNTVAHSMAAEAAFPVLAVEMIGVGEESGNLGKMLEQVAKTYEGEVQHSMSLFLAILEPMLIIGMVGVIGILAVAILLPIFNMNSAIGQ